MRAAYGCVCVEGGFGLYLGELCVLILHLQRCYSDRGKSEDCLRLCVCEGGGGGGGGGSTWGGLRVHLTPTALLQC